MHGPFSLFDDSFGHFQWGRVGSKKKQIYKGGHLYDACVPSNKDLIEANVLLGTNFSEGMYVVSF